MSASSLLFLIPNFVTAKSVECRNSSRLTNKYLNRFNQDSNNLEEYQKLKSYCLNNYSNLTAKAERDNATGEDLLLAGIALLLKARKGQGIPKQNLLDRAEDILLSISADCLTAETKCFLGVVYYEMGNWEKAKQIFASVLEEKSDFYLANYYLMKIHMVDGNFGEALTYANKIPLEKLENQYFRITFPNLAIYKARIFLGLREINGISYLSPAQQVVDQAPYIDTTSVDYKVLQAEILLEQGEFGEAEQKLLDIANKHPDNVYVRFALGKYYQRFAEHVKAFEAYKSILEISQRKSLCAEQSGYVLTARMKMTEIRSMIDLITPLIKNQKDIPDLPE